MRDNLVLRNSELVTRNASLMKQNLFGLKTYDCIWAPGRTDHERDYVWASSYLFDCYRAVAE